MREREHVVQELLFASGMLRSDAGEKVSLSDIEDRLRSLGTSAQSVVTESKKNALAAGVIGGVLLVAGAYLHGRRRGRRRASVLEIRRG